MRNTLSFLSLKFLLIASKIMKLELVSSFMGHPPLLLGTIVKQKKKDIIQQKNMVLPIIQLKRK